MGLASCAAMATSSPRGGRGCTSELAGGALLETALREVGEVAVSTTSPGSAPSLGRGSRLSWPLRLPEGVPAGARPPPTAGPPPALSPRSSRLFQASRTPSLGTWSVHGNTLGPAHRPRKCEAAAKPRPARVYGNCPQASNSTPTPDYDPPSGDDSHSGLAAARAFPRGDLPPRPQQAVGSVGLRPP